MWPTIKLRKGHEAWVVQLLFIERNCETCSRAKKKKKKYGRSKGEGRERKNFSMYPFCSNLMLNANEGFVR